MAPRKKAQKPPVSAPPSSTPPTIPFWKKTWVWFVGSVAALALLLANINSILANVRELPGEVRKTSDQFFDWYGDYPAWRGHWTNFPEGFVDIDQMNLSEDDFRIDIDETTQGQIVGSIETKGICDKTPIHERLLIDGTISSARTAKISVFEFVGGYRRDFASLNLRRDGIIMTVTPDEDPGAIFAKEARIANSPDGLVGIEDREPLCAGKEANFIMDVAKEELRKQKAVTATKDNGPNR